MLSRRPVLASFLALAACRPAAAQSEESAADPVFAAIAAARAANARHITTCEALHTDESEAADQACEAAADAAIQAIDALAVFPPTTHAGLIALVAFYIEDADGTDIGARHLESLLAILSSPDRASAITH